MKRGSLAVLLAIAGFVGFVALLATDTTVPPAEAGNVAAPDGQAVGYISISTACNTGPVIGGNINLLTPYTGTVVLGVFPRYQGETSIPSGRPSAGQTTLQFTGQSNMDYLIQITPQPGAVDYQVRIISSTPPLSDQNLIVSNFASCRFGTFTPTSTATVTLTSTVTATATATATATVTGTPATATPTVTGTPPTATPTVTGTPPTATPTVTGTPPTETPTATATVTGTPPTSTPVPTATSTGGGGGEEAGGGGGGGGEQATSTPTSTSIPAVAGVVAAGAPTSTPGTPVAAVVGAGVTPTQAAAAPTETPQVAGARAPAAPAAPAPAVAGVQVLPSAGDSGDDGNSLVLLLLAAAGALACGTGYLFRKRSPQP